MKLDEQIIIKIIKDETIDNCNEDEAKQVMDFLFGKEFMESKDKGEVKTYENN